MDKLSILKLRIKRKIAFFICPHMLVISDPKDKYYWIIGTRKWYQKRYVKKDRIRRMDAAKAVRYALNKYPNYYLEVPRKKAKKKCKR